MQSIRLLLAWLLVLLLTIPNLALGNEQKLEHVVSVEKLRQVLASKAEARERNLTEVRTFLRHETVRDYVGKVEDLKKIEAALPMLDDATLSYLAAESAKANDELRAGLSTAWTIIIIVVVVVVVLGVATYIGNRAL